MSTLEGIRIALRALRVNALRSLLTMLGIVIGVAAVVTMVAVGGGAQSQVAEQIRSMGANLLLVQPGSASASATRLGTGSRRTLTEDDAAAIAREVPTVQVAAPAVNGKAQVVFSNLNWATSVTGAVPDHLVAREWRIERGRPFTLQEVDAAAKVVLLGATVVEKLFEDEGDSLGRLVRINNVPLTVIGVLARKGQGPSGWDQDDVAFVPLSTAKLRMLGGTDRRAIGYIYVKVAETGAMAEATQQIRRLLRQRHRLPPAAEDDFLIRDAAETLEVQAASTHSLTLLLAAVASVSLVVGGISIMNIMLVSVTERTREIGLRLAVGARRRDVRHQFLVEAVTLCLLGGLAGVAAGAGTATAVARLADWPILINPVAVLLAVVFAAAVGVFFGFYPALKASRLDPIEALRFE